MDHDTGARAGASSNTLTMTVLHVAGKLVELTLRATAEDIEFIVDGVTATTVNRAGLRRWLTARGGRPMRGGRPLLDLPLTMHRDGIGVWLEIRRYVAPTLIENEMVTKITAFVNS